ncbi:MAG: hypothetical protein J6J43_01280 [Oscillospiraceae bacterium]|nr:hypothetical protein [Oscillospiraceae bacterium]
MRRFFVGFVLLLLVAALCAVCVCAANVYTGDVVAFVNTSLSSSSKTNGSFASVRCLQDTSVSSVYEDEQTGKTMTVLSQSFEPLRPVEQEEGIYQLPVRKSSYSVSSTKNIIDSTNDVTKQMECRYIGTYCTVWGAAAQDNESIRINEIQAQQIGEQFDSNCEKMVQMFGPWYDADGDTRLAILCHDISSDYGSSVDAYTAGYFHAANLVSPFGFVNGFYFGRQTYGMNMDCIHLDTYPGMGHSLDQIEDSYSTLFHEMQHLINFTYQIAGRSFVDPMEVYLDEAFAMAAEHLICGSDATSSRLWYFGVKDCYVPGTSLSYWEGTLSNYSNSYLFGQYLRTRYAALTGTDGSTFYRSVMEQRAVSGGNAIDVILQLLQTDAQQLVKDFWSAVYCKAESGVHGFMGEEWAYDIEPVLSEPVSSADRIYDGGAKFYAVDGEMEIPTELNGLSAICFKNGLSYPDGCLRGYLTDEIAWALTPEGVLTISGTGDIADLEENGMPWAAYRDEVIHVIVEEGITGIGSYVLSGFTACEHVELPSTLKKIASYAFSGKVIPNHVYYNGDRAAWNAIAITTPGNGPLRMTHMHYMGNCYSSLSDGTHTGYVACTDCGKTGPRQLVQPWTETCFDEDTDGLCDLCSAFVAVFEKVTVAGSNMVLDNDLRINFIVPNLPQDRTYTAYISQTSGEEEVGQIVVEDNEWETFNASNKKISVTVRAMEMTDTLTLVILDENGRVCNHDYATSVREYAHKALKAASSTDAFKTLIVDMLNYGAQAQLQFIYRTEDLADQGLTEEQAAFATPSVTCADTRIKGENYYGSNLALKDKIDLNLFFTNMEELDIESMYAEISYVNFAGVSKTDIVPGTQFAVYGGKSGTYKIPVSSIVVADASSPVAVKVCYADGTVFGQATDSVESYAARGASTASALLYDAIMKFASSAFVYLTSR